MSLSISDIRPYISSSIPDGEIIPCLSLSNDPRLVAAGVLDRIASGLSVAPSTKGISFPSVEQCRKQAMYLRSLATPIRGLPNA